MKSSTKVTLYYSNGCIHCVNFKPEWNNFRQLVDKQNLNIEYKEYEGGELSGKWPTINGQPIQGFPTLKLEVNGKEFEYDGERTAKAILTCIEEMGGRVGGMSGGSRSRNRYYEGYMKYKTKYEYLLKKMKK